MSIFSQVDSGIRLYHSPVNLSEEHITDGYHGKLIPIYARLFLPNSYIKIGGNLTLRQKAALIAPELTNLEAFIHFYAYPIRLAGEKLGVKIEDIITGGEDGNNTEAIPLIGSEGSSTFLQPGTLSDYFGYPLTSKDISNHKKRPNYLKHCAYNAIYNYFYRDENLQSLVSYDNNEVLNRNWRKDYFSAALPSQQKGDPIAIPLTGSASPNFKMTVAPGTGQELMFQGTSGGGILQASPYGDNTIKLEDIINQGLSMSLSSGTVDITDMRQGFATQRILERAMRCGSRFNEFLLSTWNIAPRDEVLQQPEYIGGFKQPIIVNSVTQSSESGTTELGRQAATYMSLGGGKIKTYLTKEPVIIMGILSIMPEPQYMQGLDCIDTYSTRFDFPNPSFQNLSEQPIYNSELYFSGESDDDEIFGFKGIYNEHRTAHSKITGGLRDKFDYWHLARKFSERPNLNSSFLQCDGSTPDNMRIFAVQDEAPFIIDFYAKVRALVPLVSNPTPGLIDHN